MSATTITLGLAVLLFASLALLALLGMERVVSTAEAILKMVSTSLRQSLSDYVDIENVDMESPATFVNKDGSLLTILRHSGSFRLVGKDEFEEADRALNNALAPFLDNGAHAVQFVFTVDPDLTERVVRETQQPHIATAARIGLSVADVFEEEAQHFAKRCAAESCFIALYTRPAALSPSEKKAENLARKELFKAHALPSMSDAPALFKVARLLRVRHQSFVDSVVADLLQLKMGVRVLPVHEACKEIRYAIDPEWTDEQWRPCLFGDPIPKRNVKRSREDVSGAVWPPVAGQLAPRDAEELNLRHVRIGGRIYAPMFFDLMPQDIQIFQQLHKKTANTGLPWRFSLLIESGAGLWDMKALASSIVGFTNKANNASIRRAIEEVKRASVEDGRTRVSIKIDLATWAPVTENKLLEQRASQLARAAEGWGGADVMEISGDPTLGFISGAIGASLKSPATPSLAFLDDVTHFLPLYRPASPWETGAVLFRTEDGKLWPFQPHSNVQSSWVNLIFAEMRSGKSVLGNAINLALCLSPGLTRLPLIGIIDHGTSSSGLISLLENALPPSRRHEVASIRMKNSPEFSINPCDTQLGNRYPLQIERAYLLNFVLTLVTGHGKANADSKMSAIARMAIDHAYNQASDTGQGRGKLYNRNMVGAEAVDEAIDRFGLPIDEDTTWWEVVDALAGKGAHHIAGLAQRFAVPLIRDIALAASDSSFKDMYGDDKTDDGTSNVLTAFSRMLSECIRAYPVLSRETRFDLGEARVVSIDIAEVAKSGSPALDHQTAVFYLLARRVVAKDFYLHEDDLPEFNQAYRAYHEGRIRETMQDKKHIQYDEFHRTKKVGSARDQVVGDMREGGKRGVMVTLISQDMNDFDQTMLQFASCKIVLSRANQATATDMQNIFGLTPTVEWNVRNAIRPPSRLGSTFVGIWRVRDDDYAQTLNNTMGGIKLWAFSTSNEDTIVRNALYREIGPENARRYLATLYPGGSIVDEVEQRKRKLDAISAETVLDGLILELLDGYQRARSQSLIGGDNRNMSAAA